MRIRDDSGVTLVEIIIAIVVMSITVSALFAALATGTTASQRHRDVVTADAILRGYAEATKLAYRSHCSPPSGSFSVSYSAPSGFSVNALTNQTCPAVTTTQQVQLTVTLPNATTKPLFIRVRTP